MPQQKMGFGAYNPIKIDYLVHLNPEKFRMPFNEQNHYLFLLSELKNSKESAFDFIFRKYYKALCVQANAYVKDLDKSQSLVQDCFIRLWENQENAERIKNLD